MAAISESIVREYFELHGFFVRQQRKYRTQSRGEDDEGDFLVINPRVRPSSSPLPFELTSGCLPAMARAVVVVKGWHTETFSSTMLEHAPEIFRFLEPSALQQAAKAFGVEDALTKILIVPALPQAAEARAQSIEFLRGKGVDAVIPFRALLADLISSIEVNRNYEKSDLLQVIRVLKNYEFFREPQLELFKPAKRRRPARGKETSPEAGGPTMDPPVLG